MVNPPADPTERLADEVAGLSGRVEALREQISTDIGVQEQKLAQHKRTGDRVRNAFIGVFIMFALVVGGLGWLVLDSRHEDDRRERDRLERAYASCVQTNVQINGQRNAQVEGFRRALVPFSGDNTPEEQARLEEFLEGYRRNTEELLPFRDCSPAGITKFLESPPADPATSTTTGVAP